MIRLVGAVCTTLLYTGGFLCALNELTIGLTLTALGSIGFGTLLASVQSAQRSRERFDTRDGMTVQQLRNFVHTLLERGDVANDTKVFVSDKGMSAAGAVFKCILNGHRTLVIERNVEFEPKGAEHDLF